MSSLPSLDRIRSALRRRFGARSLRTYVVALVTGCMVPMLGFSAFAVLRYANAEHADDDRQLLNTARVLSAAMDAELNAAGSALAALATSTALHDGDLARFYEQCRTVGLRHDASIVLTDPEGREILHSQRPLTEPRRLLTTSALVRTAVETHLLQVSDLYRGAGTTRMQISVVFPVVEQDQVRHVLLMTIDSEALSRVLQNQRLPESWRVSVIDRNQRIVARNRDVERFAGEPVNAAAAERIEGAEEGVFPATTLDGIPVSAVFTRSAYSGWTLAVGVPLAETAAALENSLSEIGFAAGVMLVLGILLAGAVGGRMAEVLQGLSSAALALGHGAPVPSSRRNIAEVDAVLGALNTAGTLLHQQSRRRDAAEQALRQSEQRFRDIAETAADWIWETDREHRFTYFSGAESVSAGMDAAQVLGMTRWRYAGGDADRDEHWQQHKVDLDAHRPIRGFRYTVPGEGGRLIHYSINGKPIFDPSGEFLGYRGTAANETEVVEAMERAERAETLLRDAVDSMSEGFLIYDKDDRLVMLNERYLSCYPAPHTDLEPGFTFAELIRRGIALGRFADTDGREEDLVAERVRRHQEAAGAFEQKLSDGRWLLVTDRRMRNGGIAGLRIDITALKQAQAALRVSEERLARNQQHLALAQRMAQVGSLLRDLKTGVVEWSDELYRIYGIERGSAPPSFETLLGLVHPDDRAAVVADRDLAMGGEPQSLEEYRILRPDGEMRVLNRSSKLLKDENGQPTHLLVIFRDVTEAREADTQRRTLEDQLHHSQKLEALGTLAGGIAHDLNNTLVPVIAMAKLGSKRSERETPARQSFELIYQAGLRARDLVKQVLAFSRKDPADRRSFRVHDVLQEALAMLRPTIPATIAIEREIQPVPPILGDPTQIHQVFVNLMTNAVHAIGMRFGTITVSLTALPGAKRGEPNFIRLTVRDTGCGIDEATQKRIFDPFFTTKAVGEGTGLGLSVVHGIVAGHGGKIRVESRIDHGTRFIVELPLAEAPATDTAIVA